MSARMLAVLRCDHAGCDRLPLRVLNADEKAWAKHCPKPKDWP